MTKNIIFDWSGVVKDAVKSHLWVVNKMFKELGRKEISMEEMRKNWKQPYMHFYNKYVPDLTLEEEQRAYKEIILSQDSPKSEAYPGIIDVIKKLKERGYFLTVISSDLPETIFPEIKRYDLKDVFNDVLTGVYDKTEALMDLVKKNNLNSKETFFIGDSNHEIEAARKVGVKSISVTWGFSTKQKLKLENPDFVVDNLEELEGIIL